MSIPKIIVIVCALLLILVGSITLIITNRDPVSKNVIRVLITGDNIPFIQLNSEQNSVSGFDFDVANEISLFLNKTVKFQVVDIEDVEKLLLNSGRTVIFESNLKGTTLNNTKIVKTRPYFIEGEGFIVKETTKGVTKESLKEKLFAAKENTNESSVATSYAGTSSRVNLYSSVMGALASVNSGSNDVAVVPYELGRAFVITNRDKIKFLPFRNSIRELSILTNRKNTKLIAELNSFLDSIEGDNTVHSNIILNYFND